MGWDGDSAGGDAGDGEGDSGESEDDGGAAGGTDGEDLQLTPSDPR